MGQPQVLYSAKISLHVAQLLHKHDANLERLVCCLILLTLAHSLCALADAEAGHEKGNSTADLDTC